MDVYRIGYRRFSKNPLNGEGSFLFGGRWSSAGTRVAYTSTTLTLAMTEFLAHVRIENFDPDDPPALIYVHAVIPDRAVRAPEQLGIRLPRRWRDVPAPAAAAAVGDTWVAHGASLALVVPSVHVPIETPERNVLVNPLHRDFAKVTARVRGFAYDHRLVATRTAGLSVARTR